MTTEYSIHSTSEGVFVAKAYRMSGDRPAADFRVGPFYSTGRAAKDAYDSLVAKEKADHGA